MRVAYFDYSPYFQYMEKLGISQNRLIKEFEASRGVLDSMRKHKSLTLETCIRYMKFLGITDFADFVICTYKEI